MVFRDRIVRLERVPASQLRPSPKNWRKHPPRQRAVLNGIENDVGIADAVLARQLADGSLELIDGHLRAETAGDELLPVLVLDVAEHEAEKLLAVLDPLTSLAETDDALLSELVSRISTDDAALQSMLAELAHHGDEPPAMETPERALELRELYQVIVECRDETDQRTLFERLREEGYSCRLSVL